MSKPDKIAASLQVTFPREIKGRARQRNPVTITACNEKYGVGHIFVGYEESKQRHGAVDARYCP